MAEPADLNLDELKRRGRRRLIGAIVLALVAAVVVPMLLESEPKPLGEDVSVRIPPVDDGKFKNKLGESPPRKSLADAEKSVLAPGSRPTGPAASPPPAQQAPTESAAVAAAPAASTTDGAKPAAPAPASPAPPKAAATDPPPPAPKADATKGGFVVQLAAFSDDKGANALANKLKRSGYPAYTESLNSARGTLWRVRVGPFTTRDAAGQSRDRLKGEGHAGIVVPAK